MTDGRGPFWAELNRRHVVRVLVTYLVVAGAVAGAADGFLPGLGAPEWALATALAILILRIGVSTAVPNRNAR